MSEDSRNNTGIGFTIYLPGQATKAPPKPSDPTIPRLVRKDEPLPPDPEDAECREPPDDRWAAAARTIRNRTDELSQDCAFYPITSVTYSGSGDVDFEAHEPLVRSFDRGARAERVYISRVAQELLHGRYVYLLMNTSALVGWFDHNSIPHSDEHTNDMSVLITGKPRHELESSPFVVIRAFGVFPDGYQEESMADVRAHASQGKFPPRRKCPSPRTFRVTVFANQVIWAYGSPFPLTEQQIASLESADWKGFSKVSFTRKGRGDAGTEQPLRLVALEEPGSMKGGVYASGIPVIDPLLILEDLADKQAVACDNLHSHLGRFRDDPEGRLGFKRYEAAVGVLPLFRRAQVSVSRLEREIQTFEDRYRTLDQEAEAAASSLIPWLDSEPMKFIERLAWSCPDDYDLQAYRAFAAVYGRALSRMTETEIGKTYVGEVLDELERTSAPSRGGARVVADFVLPADGERPASLVGATQAIGEVVAEMFSVLVPPIVQRTLADITSESIQAGVAEGRTFLTIKRAVDKLNFAVGGTLLSVKMTEMTVHTHVGVSGLSFRGGRGVGLKVERTTLKVVASETSALGAAVTKFNAVLDVLNGALLVGSIREALKREHRDDVQTAADALRVAKSALSISAAHVTLRSLAPGKPNMGLVIARKEASKLAGRLAIIGTVVDIVASTADAASLLRTGDRDAAFGSIVSATGGGMLLVALFAASNPAGWVVAGLLVGAVGSGWAEFFKDTPFDKLYNHSPYGLSPLTDSLGPEDPAWAMTTKDYTAWDRTTLEGVDRFLQAAQQLQFAFSVRGAIPSGPRASYDAAFEIVPRDLLDESTFHIEYVVTYAGEGVFRDQTWTLRGYIWLVSLLRNPTLTDFASEGPDLTETNFEMAGAIEVRDGIIKVSLRPAITPYGKHREGSFVRKIPMSLDSVTLKVRLDVHGDAYEQAPALPLNRGEEASLVVPTTVGAGPHMKRRWVKATLVKGKEASNEVAYSYKSNFLA